MQNNREFADIFADCDSYTEEEMIYYGERAKKVLIDGSASPSNP